MQILIDGLRVGHWTDTTARTGCTVLLFPEGTIASGEVRGGSPATREFDVLSPERTVENLNSLVLSGGSAFGLAAADGVVGYLADSGTGFATSAGPVPIVVGLALFDLLEGDGLVYPGPGAGRAAAEAALPTSESSIATGLVGAGTGATVGKWRGPSNVRPGGFGVAVARHEHLTVAALLAVNAAGDIGEPASAEAVADGTFAGWPNKYSILDQSANNDLNSPALRENTTIGAVVTDATLSKADCHLLAISAHDGLARAIFPAHTRSDGDALVAAATGAVAVDGREFDLLRILTTAAVQRAAIQAC